MTSKNIANFIKKIHEKPFLSGAKLRKIGDNYLVESNWVYTDVEKAEKSHFQRSWIYTNEDCVTLPTKSFVPRENLKTRSPPRPDGKWVEVVEIKVGEGKELIIDLWDEQGRIKRVSINKQVSKVNCESHITGLPKLSPDGKFCIFSAELKTEKKSFYDQLAEDSKTDSKPESKSDKKVEYGTKNYSERSWGEQITDVVSPKLVKVCFESAEVQVQTFDDFSTGDVQISPNGKIVFCALNEKPFKLGRIFCTNRPMAIYEVNSGDLNNVTKLTDDEYSYRLPRFIPNTNKVVLLKRRPYGPHMDCDQIVVFDLDSKVETLLVDRVASYPKSDADFPGVFAVNFKTELEKPDNI